MSGSSFIRGVLLPVLVAISLSGRPASCKTLDEIIAGASEDVSGFDFMGDLSGGTVRQELDMILTIEQFRGLQGLSADDPSESSREKRKAIKSLSYRWPRNEIPYRMASGVFSTSDTTEIRNAMQEWEQNTCIRFRRANSRDQDYVQFQDGSGCSSYVGMSGGAHPIALAGGCRVKGVIAHEIGHAVGFFHEQNRPDRDEYIIIQKQNIISPNLHHNFDKYPWSSVSTYDVPYDYRSIMHYGGRAFSGNGQYTIKTIDPAYQEVIGNREGLSFNDIKLANLMYKCNDHCDASVRCPNQGFLGKDCTCWCPGNPVQKCDSTGSVVTERPTVRPTVRPTSPPCEDMNQYCPGWAGEGYCQTNTYVKTYCKKSCRLCNGVSTTEASCRDMREHCGFWRDQGYCTGRFEIFMSENCPKTCGRCGLGRRRDDNSEENGAGFFSSSIVLMVFGVLGALRNWM